MNITKKEALRAELENVELELDGIESGYQPTYSGRRAELLRIRGNLKEQLARTDDD